MSALKHVQNHPLPAQNPHDQWRNVPVSFQPPFSTGIDNHIPMSTRHQTPCQATPCLHGPEDVFGPMKDEHGNPTGFRWTSDCKLIFGPCPTV